MTSAPLHQREPISQALHRHDLSDHHWSMLDEHLPGRAGTWGGIARDNRQFVNAVLWIFRTGSRWRDLPADYGDWSNTHRRFCRWRDKGIWEKLLEVFMDEADFEWLMIDATHGKVQQHGADTGGGNQAMGRTTGGATPGYIWPWMRMVCRSERVSRQLPKRFCL